MPGTSAMTGDMLDRVAGAPITWGVDGSPGWGHMMDRDRVLNEMVDLGLTATELGPDGYLPTDPAELTNYLSSYGLRIVGGFVPALLYRPDRIDSELERVKRASRQLAAAGSKILVLGPSTDHAGYDLSSELTEDEWAIFLKGLNRVEEITADSGLATAVHPHWGMAIERPHHIYRLLESSSAGVCLDTGHVFLGGGDAVEVARRARGRVIHVHLKDVEPDAAAGVRSGEVPFRQAVVDGMFVPLGLGAVDLAGVIQELEARSYRGWYVLEQDVSLSGDPEPDGGPKADAVQSLEFLRRLASAL